VKKPVTLLVAVVVVVGMSHATARAGDLRMLPVASISIRMSKILLRHVCSLSVSPRVLDWKGSRVVIKEAWIEKRLFPHLTLNPFKWIEQDGYNLVITLAEGGDVLLSGNDEPSFYWEGEEYTPEYFGSGGTDMFWNHIKALGRKEYRVYFGTTDEKTEITLSVR
jgi:hypothetical protein